MELPVKVDDENGNYKNFVENLIQFSAYVLKYKNFDKIKEALTQLDTIYKTNTKVNIEIDNNPCYI